MTLIEFLAARDDPASLIGRLDLAEYRDWLLMIAAVDGKSVVPIIGQTQARVERDLMTTKIVVTDRDNPAGARTFKLVARNPPLSAVAVVAAPPAAPVDHPAPATVAAPAGGWGAWDKFVQLLSSEARLRIHPEQAAPAFAGPPAAPAIPVPSTAEDRDALSEITVASARIATQAASVLDLPSPPPILLDGLIADLQRQLDNFAMQQQMVARQPELAAFPVKLDAVIADIEYLMRRATTLRSHPVSPPSVWKPTPAKRAAVPASPRALKQSADIWEQLTIAPVHSNAIGGPAPARAAPDHAAQVAAAAARAKAHAAAMKAQKDEFAERDAAHKRQQDAYDKTNAEWLAAFKKR